MTLPSAPLWPLSPSWISGTPQDWYGSRGFLSSEWNVSEVRHSGISGTGATSDCHLASRASRAIDFVGVRIASGGVVRDVHVFDHWGSRPVPAPDRPGKLLPQWPPGTVPWLTYRLAAVDDLGILSADTVVTTFFFAL
ncbi:hypothetical protein [Streptomyces roseifaciens]|uniref:hypothetical protein n=1 Tax=Streptomyces roseifaciens TaxID=1488406 RepID=UPI000B1D8CD3|nr:hypothetical protein [Streptomyces roseifaciens]